MTVKFNVVKNVTLPLLKMVDEKEIYVRIETEVFAGKEVVKKKGEEQLAPAELMRVINWETGEEMEIIVNSVLKGTLEEEYVDGSYVGKSFAITRHAKKQGKRYHTFTIKEIDVQGVDETEAA
jgi:hypothetical protein